MAGDQKRSGKIRESDEVTVPSWKYISQLHFVTENQGHWIKILDFTRKKLNEFILSKQAIKNGI